MAASRDGDWAGLFNPPKSTRLDKMRAGGTARLVSDGESPAAQFVRSSTFARAPYRSLRGSFFCVFARSSFRCAA
jgi:hypothetical protein